VVWVESGETKLTADRLDAVGQEHGWAPLTAGNDNERSSDHPGCCSCCHHRRRVSKRRKQEGQKVFVRAIKSCSARVTDNNDGKEDPAW